MTTPIDRWENEGGALHPNDGGEAPEGAARANGESRDRRRAATSAIPVAESAKPDDDAWPSTNAAAAAGGAAG